MKTNSILRFTAIVLMCALVGPGLRAERTDKEMNRFISNLMKRMTLDEKIGQLTQAPEGYMTGPDNSRVSRAPQIQEGKIGAMLGVTGLDEIRKFQEAAVKSRLGIPLLFGYDVIHGYRTGFPIPLAEAASFDLDAIGMSARCSAREAAASGLHWTFAPMVDVSWDPRWGRVMEGAGEDPYYGALVAATRVKNIQGENLADTATILACVKHFGGYGAPIGGKDYNSVDMSAGHFANFYMPPYKAGAEAGAATFMSAFSDMNNIPCTANEFLLRKLLRDTWGFSGFVVSDWGSVEELINHRYAADKKDAALKALTAGLDMEMATECYSQNLKELVKEGKVPMRLIDDAVRRVLEQKYRLGLFEDPFRYCNPERERVVVGSEQSHDEARRMAERSIVLLKNNYNILPLSQDTKKVALVGPLAKSKRDMVGSWTCADVDKTVTLHDALAARGVEVDYHDGYDMETNKIVNLQQTLDAARRADVVIVAIGERARDTGEMASKADIEVPAEQQRLVSELLKTGKPVVVLMMSGRPVIFNRVKEEAPAILCTWWLGTEAGPAICNVLWGDYNPSAKLPMSFPAHIGQLPLSYLGKSTGRPTAKGGWCTKYRDISTEPAFPFGFGLSYTDFSYSDPRLLPASAPGEYAVVEVDVTNSGRRAGEEVVQLYVRDEVASVTRPIKELRGFEKIALAPGETGTVRFPITDKQLGFYDNNLKYTVEPGAFTFLTGSSSSDADLRPLPFTLK